MSKSHKRIDCGRSITSLLGLLGLLMLTGCGQGRAPSFLILGSYFPAWLVGVAISIPITVVIRAVLVRSGVDDALPARLLVYSGLSLLLTLAFTYAFSPR